MTLSLGACAATQWMLSRTMRNDAFVDEATYIVSGQLLHAAAQNGAAVPPIASYLSGAPHLYPLLAATIFDRAGLEGVRALSLACLLIATVAVCIAARQLFASRVAAVAAAALFSLQAPVLFLGRFATYDAPCVALLAVSLALGLDRRAQSQRVTAVLAGIAIGFASVMKYATLLYLPGIVIVAALVAGRTDRVRRGALALVAAALTATVLVLLGQPHELLNGFVSTTLSRAATSGGRAVDLVLFAATLGGAAAALALPAVVVAPNALRGAAITIFGFALLAPLNHIRLHEFVSLHKHMAFALVLFTVLAGGSIDALLIWLVRRWHRGHHVIAVAVGAAAIAICARAVVRPGIEEASRLYRYWPNNTGHAYLALAPLTSTSSQFLSEEPDLGTLYLGQRAPVTQWVHPYYFDYDGQRARTPTDVDTYRRAIRDGYFTAVVLRFGPQREWANGIEEELLRSQPRYRLAVRLPFELVDGPGAYQLWVRADAPGADQVH